MARPLRLRPVTRSERRLLEAKLKDLSLAARIHQRYRIIEEVRKGNGIRGVDGMGSGMTIDLSPTALYAESCGSPDMSIVVPDPQDVIQLTPTT